MSNLYEIFDSLLTLEEKSELKKVYAEADKHLSDQSEFIRGKVAMSLLSKEMRASILQKFKQAREEAL